jgi:hypothetical protein
MISASAREAFEFFAKQAIKGALPASADDRCEVTVIEDVSQVQGKQLVMLTVSSYLFRAMTLLHYTLDDKLKQHLAAISRKPVDELSDSECLDVLGEVGNILCGALNRDLAHHIPYLGMSTPNFLDNHCLDFIDALGASFVRHFEIDLNGSLKLYATLAVSEFADIDFRADTTVVEENHGELEMF